jgi:hypothetical protein
MQIKKLFKEIVNSKSHVVITSLIVSKVLIAIKSCLVIKTLNDQNGNPSNIVRLVKY